IGADVFSAFVEANAWAARLIERTAARRLHEANEQRRIITTASGERRLAALVCWLAERYGQAREAPGGLVPVPVAVRGLAGMCALPPGTADGIARKWTRSGLVGFDGTGILLRHPPSLWRLFDDAGRRAGTTREHRAIQAWEDFQRLQAGVFDEL